MTGTRDDRGTTDNVVRLNRGQSTELRSTTPGLQDFVTSSVEQSTGSAALRIVRGTSDRITAEDIFADLTDDHTPGHTVKFIITCKEIHALLENTLALTKADSKIEADIVLIEAKQKIKKLWKDTSRSDGITSIINDLLVLSPGCTIMDPSHIDLVRWMDLAVITMRDHPYLKLSEALELKKARPTPAFRNAAFENIIDMIIEAASYVEDNE